jgi:hypothetical protein
VKPHKYIKFCVVNKFEIVYLRDKVKEIITEY